MEGYLCMEIKEFQIKDSKHAIQFSVIGMNFDLYISNTWLRKLYGRYVWYLALNRATQIIAAYEGNTLAGILLAEMDGERPTYNFKRNICYIKSFEFVQNMFFKDSAAAYEDVNKAMFEKYREPNTPHGEIIFFAANPDMKNRGIGTMLLAELERREKGKQIYLYTDTDCTYQFYESKGFTKVGETHTQLDFWGKKKNMVCLLYSKTL